jgi:hypothetical protein
MKVLSVVLFFFISISLFGQIEIDRIGEYQQLIFNVRVESNRLMGTAFIVGKNESHCFLATAKHVLNGSQEAILISLDGTQHKATLVAEHDVYDLALLQTPLFPLTTDELPIVTDIAMNDEVGFVSLKDRGKVLPSKGTGIVRDVTGESLSIIMREVEQGHSGSPLLSKDGIAGVIVKNGRFIECLNIMLVKEIVEEWAEDLFVTVFVERGINRLKLADPKTIKDKEIEILSVKAIESGKHTEDLSKLVDNTLATVWSTSVAEDEATDVLVTFENLVSLTLFKIFISENSPDNLPDGHVYVINNDKYFETFFQAILAYKERDRNGYWYVYRFLRPQLATHVKLFFTHHQFTTISYYLNEVEFYGVEL